MKRRLRVHIISETEHAFHGQGVHTAFVESVALLKSKDDVAVVVNNRGKGDVMHSHTYGLYYFWKGRGYKGRRILTVHVVPDSIRGSLPMWRMLMPSVRWYFRRVYRYADVCIVISPEVERVVRALAPHTEIRRINNPIHPASFAPSIKRRAQGRRLLHLDEKEFVVLGVGQVQGRKGVDDFIRLAIENPDMTFVWVGGRPFGVMTEGIRRIERSIRAGGKNLRFAGQFPLERMPLIYNAADALLFLSYQENSPLVPIEAAAAGLPVIYRDLPAYKTLYMSPYLKAKSKRGFALLLRRLKQERAFYKHAKDLSKGMVAQFDEKTIRKQLLDLYKDLVQR